MDQSCLSCPSTEALLASRRSKSARLWEEVEGVARLIEFVGTEEELPLLSDQIMGKRAKRMEEEQVSCGGFPSPGATTY